MARKLLIIAVAILVSCMFVVDSLAADPKRYTDGITNVPKANPLGMLRMPDPTIYHVYFDDFDRFDMDDWFITAAETGVTNYSVRVNDENHGVLLINPDTNDNDDVYMQLAASGVSVGGYQVSDIGVGVAETFKLVSGKRCFFKTRMKMSGVSQFEFAIGLQVTDTSPLDVDDGVFFQKDDGDTNLDFHVEKDGAQSSSIAVTTLSDDTYLTFGFYFDGDETFDVYVNDVWEATVSTSSYPNDEELAVSIGFQMGEAALSGKTGYIDYIFIANER